MRKRKRRPSANPQGTTAEQVAKSQPVNRPGLRRSFVLLPCIAAFLIFLPTVRFGFLGDDHAQIERNPQVQSWSYLPRLLTTDMWSQKGVDHEGFFYRPLFSVWLLTFYSLAGPTPGLWHLASILLHAAATFLVFKLIFRLTNNLLAASFGALVFAIHPIHIEAVSWVSAANELFYTICILGALLLIQESQASAWDNKETGALLLWAAALFFKETAILLLILFVFASWAKLQTSTEGEHRAKIAFLKAIPWVVTAGFYLGIRTIVLQRFGLESGKQPWGQALLSAPGLFVFYLKKLVFPWRLSGFYYEDIITSPTVGMWTAGLFILTLGTCLLWAAYRRHYLIALSGVLIFLPLLPVLGGLRIYEHGNIAHDRYLYLPSAGLCLLAGILVQKIQPSLSRWNLLAGSIATVVISTGIYLNLSQQSWYADDDTYYRRAVELYPRNFLGWELWAQFNFSHKNPKEGLEKAVQAYRLAPENVSVAYYYARGLFENRRFLEAEPLLQQLSKRTDQKTGRRKILLLAVAQSEMGLGKFLEAENALNALSQMDDAFPGLHSTWGNLYQLQGKLNMASQEFMKDFQLTGDLRSKRQAIALDAGAAIN